MARIEPGPGQESVWDYPRPPKLEKINKHISVYFNNELIADTRGAWRVLETSHPPVYYIPPEDIRTDFLKPAQGGSWCEWKGQAAYFDIKDHVAFYAGLMDRCLANGEEVTPQPGGFYSGWITADIVGPFKGAPGTSGW